MARIAKPAAPPRLQTPGAVYQPDTYHALQKGINLVAGAIRPTLGPVPRLVAINHVTGGNRPPEMLDNGGLIARRIFELCDRDADMGAMLLRQVLWKQHEDAGDGTATAAVLFQTVFNEGVKYIAAGGNPMRLRHFLEKGMRLVLDALRDMALPLEGQAYITQLARSMCHDEALAEALGEVFDVVGEHGALEIRTGHSRDIECEYLDGAYYSGGVHSAALLPGVGQSVEITDAAVFISDLEFDAPEQIVRLIALAHAMQKKALLVIARKISEKVMAVLVSVNKDPRFRVIAVKAPDDVRGQSVMLDDLAALCGGRVFLNAVRDSVNTAQVNDLGVVRRAWADPHYFGIAGGKGSPLALRSYIAGLYRALERACHPDIQKQLRERVGKLWGGAAVLRIGGATEPDITARRAAAERTASAIRAALRDGVLPGGGSALLACRPLLKRLAQQAGSLDERMAYSILCRALEEPLRVILQNAGVSVETTLHQIKKPGTGYDVRSGKIVEMAKAGVLDSAGVTLSAVHKAFSSAALALTVDVLVHHRSPQTSVEP